MAKVKVTGSGSVVQMEKGKQRGKCRRWQLRVSTGLDPRTGRYLRKTRIFNGTYTEAQRALNEFIEDIESGGVQLRSSYTFNEYSERYLERRRAAREIADTTLEKQGFMYHAAAHHIGFLKLEQITPQVLDDMYASMLKGDTLSGKPSHGSYVKQLHDNLVLVFASAVEEGLLASNPCDRATPPKQDTKPKKAVPKDKVQQLIDELDPAKPNECAYLLAVTMGLRRGEICGLSWGDIDFESNIVNVNRSYDTLGNLKGTKTKAGTRLLPLHPVAREGLLKLKEQQKIEFEKNNVSRREHKATRGEKPIIVQTDESPVITGRYGRRVTPQAMSRWWSTDRKKYGLEGFTLHELRHTYLTMLAMSGVHPKVMQELAGHYSSQITMDIYTHVNMDAKRNAMEALTKLF